MGDDVSGREGSLAPDALLALALVPVAGEQQGRLPEGTVVQSSRGFRSRGCLGRQRVALESSEAGRGVAR